MGGNEAWGRKLAGRLWSGVPSLNSLPHLAFSHKAHTLSQGQILRQWWVPAPAKLQMSSSGPHEGFSVFSLRRIWGQLTSHIPVIADSTLHSRLVRRQSNLPSSPSAPAGEKGGAFSSHLGPNISGVRGDQPPPEKPVGVQISSVTWERRGSRSLKSDFTGSGMVGFRAAHRPHLQLALC